MSSRLTISPVPYTPEVEQISPDEEQLINDITNSMMQTAHKLYSRYQHGYRPVHAKSHGLLRATLDVLPDLPEPLAQGLFANPKTYDAILRFSTTPGDMLADSVSTPRGLSVKVLNANTAGPMLPSWLPDKTPTSQDFVLVNGRHFPLRDLHSVLNQHRLLEKHVNNADVPKTILSSVARGANAVLSTVGIKSMAVDAIGHPQHHILGESFASLVPLRYGNYIAKIEVAPHSDNLKALTDKHLDLTSDFAALRNAIVEFFQSQTAVWKLQVQLCTDITTMPVEDASVEWPDSQSPYIPVALITAEPQNAYSPERLVYVDEQLMFSPWNGLEAHRPLGQIMRARKKSYTLSAQYRTKMNARPPQEPTTITDLPA